MSNLSKHLSVIAFRGDAHEACPLCGTPLSVFSFAFSTYPVFPLHKPLPLRFRSGNSYRNAAFVMGDNAVNILELEAIPERARSELSHFMRQLDEPGRRIFWVFVCEGCYEIALTRSGRVSGDAHPGPLNELGVDAGPAETAALDIPDDFLPEDFQEADPFDDQELKLEPTLEPEFVFNPRPRM